MHMPRSQTPVVSPVFAIATLGTHAFQRVQTVSFPRHHNGLSMLSLWTTIIQFSELGYAAYTLTTPGFKHTLLDMLAGFITGKVATLAWWDSFGFPSSPTG